MTSAPRRPTRQLLREQGEQQLHTMAILSWKRLVPGRIRAWASTNTFALRCRRRIQCLSVCSDWASAGALNNAAYDPRPTDPETIDIHVRRSEERRVGKE